MAAVKETIDAVAALEKYAHGFTSDIEQEFAPKGLNADIVRFISEKKGEPEWMLEWRLAAYERWLAMEEPTWAAVRYEPVDYQDLFYYAAPKKKEGPKSLDEVDPEILEIYKKLGIPLIGVVDTNHSPIGIDYVIPGNDDSSKAVELYARGLADAVLEGRASAMDEVVKAASAESSDEFVEVDSAAA